MNEILVRLATATLLLSVSAVVVQGLNNCQAPPLIRRRNWYN